MPVEIACTFLRGFLVEGTNAEKCGDSRKKKLFINNSVKALIPFKEEYQGLLKLHVPLEEGGVVPVWE